MRVFGITTADDLYDKLQADHAALRADPLNSHAAYNFVVTAWHLREWKFADREERAEVCRRHPILRVCEHLAVGAKHMRPDPQRHRSVADSSVAGVWAPGTWAPKTWAKGTWGEWLQIDLDSEARELYGASLRILDFAVLVMQAWAQEFGR